MNATANTDLKSPLEALQERVSQQKDTVAMVQPLGGGTLREYTWKELDDEARRMASYLKGLNLPAGSNIALMSKNCAEWMLADWAIWMAGHVSVPLYPTLTAESVRQILEHSESKLLFVGKLDVWDEAKAGVPADMPKLSFSLSPDDARKEFPCWPDIIRDQQPLADVARPRGQDLATIIYTSGTTGVPKGVMHSFGNLALMGNKMPDVYELSSSDRMISYLPLSHVAERAAVELSLLYVGMRVFFAESLETFADDIKRAEPTLFFAVPRIWTKFYQKASDAVPPEKLNKLLKIPLLNRVIKKKVLSAMGLQHCRIALSGASALSKEVIVWFKKLGLEILEVYGMTENMAWSHTTRQGDQKIGWVGTPNDGVECRIGDNGEILVRSPANMQGYFKSPEKTREDLTEDGWLHTGDVGEIDEAGRLRITGRVKEIFKTEKGKYVAPAPIEGRFVSHPGIDQACVMGVDMPQPVILVCLSPEEEEHLSSDKARDEYVEGLKALLQRVNGEIDAHERLDALVVVSEAWGVENNLLTPTLKLKRNELEKLYQDRLAGWAKQRGVVWAR
ncbi:AMP-binding protein [Alcanivorax sp. JB21]|uniref:AMP-binding protein n=1 Tax=Alcanivorax limicola TaxID=2874102 RepID=UPI001CBB872E|nr:AMP-binding protein [Alcanivorax limicola]MBZ2190584.1 AMP-binding protein [Alcanivorax limicola]